MSGDGELEPKDSRNVTGAARTPDGRWGETSDKAKGGELEPKDSRNVTGTAVTDDGRWTGAAVRPGDDAKAPDSKK